MTVKAKPPKSKPKGIQCAACGCCHFRVVYTRPRQGHILRAKACRNCGRRVFTREVLY